MTAPDLPAVGAVPAPQDYAAFRARAMDLVPKLCAEVWTDYNAHDPGVTFIEQICYALTELGYYVERPVAGMLGAWGRGSGWDDLALFSARRMEPAAPLTLLDHQRLLLDRLPGLAGAWPLRTEREGADRVEWRLFAPGLAADDPERRVLQAHAERLLERHRNLCEPAGRVMLLRPRRLRLGVTVDLKPGWTPELVVAAMLRCLELELAPEVRRRNLAEALRMVEDASIAAVMEGPPLRNGWIAEAELARPPARFAAARLTRLMAGTPGVAAVRDLELGDGDVEPGADIHVGRDEVLELDIGRRTPFGVAAMVGGERIDVDFDRVHAALCDLRAERRAPRPLWRQLGERLARPHPVADASPPFAPLQTDLPVLYGLQEGQRTPQGVAQLRGYLLTFDLLILKQLCEMHDAVAGGLVDPQAFYDRIRQEVFGAEDLVRPTAEVLDAAHRTNLAKRRAWLARRLALYGYSSTDLAPDDGSLAELQAALGWASRRPGERRRAPVWTAGRLRRPDLQRVLELRFGLGRARLAFHQALTELEVTLRGADSVVEVNGREGRPLAQDVFERLWPAPSDPDFAPHRDGAVDIPYDLLDEPVSVRFGRSTDGGWLTALHCGRTAWVLTRHDRVDAARWAAGGLFATLTRAARAAEQVFLLEHARLGDHGAETAVFTLFVCAPGRGRSTPFREAVSAFVRAQAPAHLHARVVFVGVKDVLVLERLVRDLYAGDKAARDRAAKAARRLIDERSEQPVAQ